MLPCSVTDAILQAVMVSRRLFLPNWPTFQPPVATFSFRSKAACDVSWFCRRLFLAFRRRAWKHASFVRHWRGGEQCPALKWSKTVTALTAAVRLGVGADVIVMVLEFVTLQPTCNSASIASKRKLSIMHIRKWRHLATKMCYIVMYIASGRFIAMPSTNWLSYMLKLMFSHVC